jgi:hypothetical protein
MKKLIFVILFLIYALSVKAQFYDENGNLLVSVNNAPSVTITNLPTITKHLGATDTIAGTWIDTLSRVIQGYVASAKNLDSMKINSATVILSKFWISIVTDDTLEYCTNIAFPNGMVTTVYPGSFTENSTYLIPTSTVTNFYIRRKGTVGTVTYSVALRGN